MLPSFRRWWCCVVDGLRANDVLAISRTKLPYLFEKLLPPFHGKPRWRNYWRKLLFVRSPSWVSQQADLPLLWVCGVLHKGFPKVLLRKPHVVHRLDPFKSILLEEGIEVICPVVRGYDNYHLERLRAGHGSPLQTPPPLWRCHRDSPLLCVETLSSAGRSTNQEQIWYAPQSEMIHWCYHWGQPSPSTQDTASHIDSYSDQNSYVRGEWGQIPLSCGAPSKGAAYWLCDYAVSTLASIDGLVD